MSTTQITRPDQDILSPGVWEIDPAHSNVEFVARHLLSKVRGRFTEFEGSITIDADPSRSSVEAQIQAASIDTHNPDRDAHLRNPDFLDVERFPTLSFRSTAVRPGEEPGRYVVEGDVTIRDVTRPVTLDVEYLGWSDDPWGGKRAGFSASTEIDRDDFGANWNVVLETGGVLLGKTVRIELEIEAVLRSG
jgi:polyisoprenoid-binding protein YceI